MTVFELRKILARLPAHLEVLLCSEVSSDEYVEGSITQIDVIHERAAVALMDFKQTRPNVNNTLTH